MPHITLDIDDTTLAWLTDNDATPKDLRDVLEDALMEYARNRSDARAWVLFRHRPNTESRTAKLAAQVTRTVGIALAVRRFTNVRLTHEG